MAEKPKRDALQVVKIAWVLETIFLILVGVVLLFVVPERVDEYLKLLPYFSALVAAQGAAAFGGPLIKGAINGEVH